MSPDAPKNDEVARTDLHFHLLPGLDDGPGSIEESVQLARLAAWDGTGTLVEVNHEALPPLL